MLMLTLNLRVMGSNPGCRTLGNELSASTWPKLLTNAFASANIYASDLCY